MKTRGAAGFDAAAAVRRARAQLRESCRVKQRISAKLLAELAEFARLTLEAFARGRRVYFFGNGGSAAGFHFSPRALPDRTRATKSSRRP